MADQEPIRYELITGKVQPGPNCEWRINRPDLGMVGIAVNFEGLLRVVKEYRRANGIPIGLGLEDELEQALCQAYPDYCKSSDPRAPVHPRNLRYNDVFVGTKVMARFFASGREVVEPEEAARRASICAGCRLNVQFSRACGGGLCGELKTLVEAIVGGKTTIYDSQLNSCFICACYLSSAIWLPLQTQIPPLSDFQKAQFENVPNCWKKQSLIPPSA